MGEVLCVSCGEPMPGVEVPEGMLAKHKYDGMCVVLLRQRKAQLLTERDEARKEAEEYRQQLRDQQDANKRLQPKLDKALIVIEQQAERIQLVRAEAAALRAALELFKDDPREGNFVYVSRADLDRMRALRATEGAGRDWLERYRAMEAELEQLRERCPDEARWQRLEPILEESLEEPQCGE